jgi:hypothetical protein
VKDLLPGWKCRACFAFNGDVKERLESCRACSAPRPRRPLNWRALTYSLVGMILTAVVIVLMAIGSTWDGAFVIVACAGCSIGIAFARLTEDRS